MSVHRVPPPPLPSPPPCVTMQPLAPYQRCSQRCCTRSFLQPFLPSFLLPPTFIASFIAPPSLPSFFFFFFLRSLFLFLLVYPLCRIFPTVEYRHRAEFINGSLERTARKKCTNVVFFYLQRWKRFLHKYGLEAIRVDNTLVDSREKEG